MKRIVLVGFTWVLCLTAGCELTGSGAPKPPGPVTAELPEHSPFFRMDDRPCDVSLLAQCVSIDLYAQTKRGDWITNWYLTRWHILEVREGAWEYEDLAFVFRDSWPTPESGILLQKLPVLYIPGRIFLFGLGINDRLVVRRQEPRSYLPPYGRITTIDRLEAPHTWETLSRNLQRAVDRHPRAKVGETTLPPVHWSLWEQTESAYIIEVWTDSAWTDRRVFLIDKASFEVQALAAPPLTSHSFPADR